ncbi:MAG: phytase [Acidimicrobiia bacterium]
MTTPAGSSTAPRLSAALTAAAALLAGVMALPGVASAPTHVATAVAETQSPDAAGDTVDDITIWVHPIDRTRSLVIGANHKESTVEVHDLSGRRLQRIESGGTNNIDSRPGFALAGTSADLVGVAGGGTRGGRMTFFRVDPASRELTNVTAGGSVRVTSGYGFCMYRSPRSGTLYAFGVNPGGRVEQVELFDDAGMVNGRVVRTIEVEPGPVDTAGGNPEGNDSLEACAADDGTGTLYIGEESRGIWQYGAEPTDSASTADRVLVDGTEAQGGHITPHVEGITIVYGPGASGFLIASSQGDYTYNVYRREAPHEFLRKVQVAAGPAADGCQRTDGIDAVATDLGPAFPRGLFVCQDNANTEPAAGNQNFKYVPLEQVVPLPVAPPPAPSGEAPPTSSSPPGASPPSPPARSDAAPRTGYWMLSEDGRVYPFGDAASHGQPATVGAVDLEATTSADGYWVVDRDGRVFAYGTARHLGDVHPAQLTAGETVTSLSATPSGSGYWIFTSKGRAFAFGAAPHLGDMAAVSLNGPVLDSVPTPSGTGYWMVASDGGIFSFGDARFNGSMGGVRLNAPVQSLVPDPDGVGYWLVASDGGVFAFDAAFRGSMGAVRLNRPVTGMVAYGDGYLMVAEDGGIFNFSDKPFSGSLGNTRVPHPIVAVTAVR